MKVSFASIFYFFGSTLFLIGAIWYIIDSDSTTYPYLGLACAACYFTASTIQLIYDWLSCHKKRRKEEKKNEIQLP